MAGPEVCGEGTANGTRGRMRSLGCFRCAFQDRSEWSKCLRQFSLSLPNRSLGNGSMQTCRHDPDQSFLSELSESRARHRDRETDQEKHHRPHRQQGILKRFRPPTDFATFCKILALTPKSTKVPKSPLGQQQLRPMKLSLSPLWRLGSAILPSKVVSRRTQRARPSWLAFVARVGVS